MNRLELTFYSEDLVMSAFREQARNDKEEMISAHPVSQKPDNDLQLSPLVLQGTYRYAPGTTGVLSSKSVPLEIVEAIAHPIRDVAEEEMDTA
uniref:Proteasome beta subunit C-terminal domain-containing protein n=2 Tax=Araneus ventricosus TaxID=182803 RepID=A0A4Y2QZA9_ARAVE|nr:hypothetical protein AVEN_60764-1 [Araneus ventricosus]